MSLFNQRLSLGLTRPRFGRRHSLLLGTQSRSFPDLTPVRLCPALQGLSVFLARVPYGRAL